MTRAPHQRWPRWLPWPQLLVLALSWCAGLGLGGAFWWDDIETLVPLQEQVQTLHNQLQTLGPAAQVTAVSPAATGAVAQPDSLQAARVWPWLQQRLQAHRLQLMALRPGPPEAPPAGPAQTVVLEVQGRWGDWQAFEQQMHQQAPWWTVSQWQVTPTGVAGQVKMQWHWLWHGHLGWRAADPHSAKDDDFPQWAVAPETAQAVVFNEPLRTDSAAQALGPLPSQPPLPADPGRWPVAAFELRGVWQQDGVAHAVLGGGLQPLVVTPGQRVGREAYRVQRVTQDEVVLRPTQAGAREIRLGWTGGSR